MADLAVAGEPIGMAPRRGFLSANTHRRRIATVAMFLVVAAYYVAVPSGYLRCVYHEAHPIIGHRRFRW